MTSFSPGHRPPQVTMPARVSGGLKNRCSRAPANSKSRLSSDGASTVRRMVAGTRSDSSTQRFRGDGKCVAPRTGMFMDGSPIIPRTFPEVKLCDRMAVRPSVLQARDFEPNIPQLIQYTLRPLLTSKLLYDFNSFPVRAIRGND